MRVSRPILGAGLAVALFGATLILAHEALAQPKRIPAAARGKLKKALNAAMDSIPGPAAPYMLRPEESSLEVGERALWDATSRGWWKPGSATAERYYEVPEEVKGISEAQRELLGPIELRLELNGDLKIGGLASEGGEPALFPIDGAVAVEVSTIAPGEAGGRVVTMTAGQAEYRLAELTVVLGDELLERSVRNTVEKRKNAGGVRNLTSDPAEIRSIFIRLHGPKKPVEDLARRIPTVALRRLLRG